MESYVQWIDPARGHEDAIRDITRECKGISRDEFDALYRSMDAVDRFGRLARLDYLTTAYRLGVISAVPGSPYLVGATGPLEGARLMFGGSQARDIEPLAIQFGTALGVDFAVLEDALCNWQKSPHLFRRFRG